MVAYTTNFKVGDLNCFQIYDCWPWEGWALPCRGLGALAQHGTDLISA